jgi:HAD superfamily hydrolase (TIGR01450 family)
MTMEPCPVLCDLDGVIWLAHEPIAGSAQAVQQLRSAGHRVVFVTNNSFSTMAQHHDALERCGIEAVGDVITSSMAAATLVMPGQRAMVVGGAGIVEALQRRGVEVVDDTVEVGVDVVVVGLHRHLSYDGLANAARAVRRGAQLLGTNDDATFPTPKGPVPGGGAILAAVQVASGVEGIVAGKPHLPMAAALRQHLGVDEAVPSWWSHMVMVGDRPSTDGRFAQTLGCRFALVRSGVTEPGADPGVAVDFDAADLASLVPALV